MGNHFQFAASQIAREDHKNGGGERSTRLQSARHKKKEKVSSQKKPFR
jgi:hypothetical protein